MPELNTGIIFTNNNCIGCNRCISGCPIPGANIVVVKDSKTTIQIDNEKCIHCGHCLTVCIHNAREYRDDTYKFIEDLSNPEKTISLLVDSSFYLCYGELANNILGYLKSIGIHKIYDVSFGADISTWALANYFNKKNNISGISSFCPAVVTYFEKYAYEYTKKLIPIQSPAISLAIFIKNNISDKSNLAFLGTCIAKNDEIKECNSLIEYNVTIKHLMNYFINIDFSKYYAETDLPGLGLGNLYSIIGGLKENLGTVYKNQASVIPFDNLHERFTPLHLRTLLAGLSSVSVLETSNCELGCLFGPGKDDKNLSFYKAVQSLNLLRNKVLSDSSNSLTKSLEDINSYFSKLNENDYVRTFQDRTIPINQVSEEQISSVFEDMYKQTESQKHIDCQYCGYHNCKEMAEAIANGYSIKNNCIQYARQENERLYSTDSLTGLPNKIIFIQFCTKLIKNNLHTEYSIAQLNVTKFMLINNQFGYSVGTEAIKQITKQIKSFIQDDEFVATSGGNDYFIAIKNERINAVLFAINHIVINLYNSENSKNSELYKISIHAGVYKFVDTDNNAEKCLEKTLTAFLLSKDNNDIIYYQEKMSNEVLRNLKIGNLIPQALVNNELIVFYQPKVNISTMALSGAEALIRWFHEDKLIPPIDFIPICEKTGLIKRIDFFVLTSVCRNIREWIDDGLQPVKVSINFSKLHFLQSDIPERIRNIVDQWQIPHSLIEIEVTETAYLNSQEELANTINKLSEFGFSTAMDDFGTGYSSLSLLQDLPFDVLKIDKSLADTILENDRSKKVVKNIIHMAKDLNMNIVVEGVESEQALPIFQHLNCDSIQGFLFDKPLTEIDFRKRLSKPIYTK